MSTSASSSPESSGTWGLSPYIKPRDPSVPLTPEEETLLAARQKELFAERALRDDTKHAMAQCAEERNQALYRSPLGRIYTWFVVGSFLFLVWKLIFWIL